MVKKGDLVRTNSNWNKNHTPIQGIVTRIIPLKGTEPLPLIELNGGEHRINEFWLEKVNNDWLGRC